MKKIVLMVLLFSLTLTGCSTNQAVVKRDKSKQEDKIVYDVLDISSAKEMNQKELMEIISGMPDDDEFSRYEKLFGEYLDEKNDIYYSDITLGKWSKSKSRDGGYYFLSAKIGNVKESSSVYKASNIYGKELEITSYIIDSDSIIFDKSYLRGTSDLGRSMKGKTVRVFYMLSDSKSYLLNPVEHKGSLCESRLLVEADSISPKEVITRGCTVKASVISAKLIESGEVVKLSQYD